MNRPIIPVMYNFVFAFFLFILFSPSVHASSNEEFITEIILINQQAELVDVTDEGVILRRHLIISDYFSSNRSHESTLKISMKKLRGLSTNDKFEIPGDSNLPSICLQSYLIYRMTNRKSVQPDQVILFGEPISGLEASYEEENIKTSSTRIAHAILREPKRFRHSKLMKQRIKYSSRFTFDDYFIEGIRPLRRKEV